MVARSVRLAERMSLRLKVPADCRDAARLAARWCRTIEQAECLPPARLLDLIAGADALRRPERLRHLLDACACRDRTAAASADPFPPARIVLAALDVVRGVDAGAIARSAARPASAGTGRDERIAKAVREARLYVLRRWRRGYRPTR
jgi:tRNA nucleotidyltransferase (CCA-adding enzyme)